MSGPCLVAGVAAAPLVGRPGVGLRHVEGEGGGDLNVGGRPARTNSDRSELKEGWNEKTGGREGTSK